mmetsp:Transcript_55977/g.119031  ORF Transcript_55977/g.119031 Transcript_55977/m.119031 type:complete len:341 (-) Transcript_55977:1467-2489(-)
MQILATRRDVGMQHHPFPRRDSPALSRAALWAVPHTRLTYPVDVVLRRLRQVLQNPPLLGELRARPGVEMPELHQAAPLRRGVVRGRRVGGRGALHAFVPGGAVLGAPVSVRVQEPPVRARAVADGAAVFGVDVGGEGVVVAVAALRDGVVEGAHPAVNALARLSRRAGCRGGVFDANSSRNRVVHARPGRRPVRPILAQLLAHVRHARGAAPRRVVVQHGVRVLRHASAVGGVRRVPPRGTVPGAPRVPVVDVVPAGALVDGVGAVGDAQGLAAVSELGRAALLGGVVVGDGGVGVQGAARPGADLAILMANALRVIYEPLPADDPHRLGPAVARVDMR